MTIGNCCIEGFRSHSYCDCSVAGEYGNWYNFAMNEDGTLIALQIERVGGVSGAYAVRIFERSGTTWALKQQINDNDFEDTYYFIAFSKDGTKLVYTTYDDIKVYTRAGDTWSLTDTLTTHVTYGGTDYGGSAWHAVVKMSDDAEVIAYTGGYTFTKDAVMIWDHGVQHLIVDEVGTTYFDWAAGVSGNGQYVFAGTNAYPDSTVTEPSWQYPGGISLEPGAIKVYEKSGGTWAQVSIMYMPQENSQDAWDDHWWMHHDWSSEIVSSYDGSVVAYFTNGSYYRNDLLSATNTYMVQWNVGVVQTFRKSGAVWNFERLITAPFADQIASAYGDGSDFGYSLHMTPDGSRLMVGSQGDTSSLWEYGTQWEMIRVFDASDDFENRTDGVGYDAYAWSYGYATRISSDGSFIGIYEWGYQVDETMRVWFYEEC